jgi:hypothetical protein
LTTSLRTNKRFRDEAIDDFIWLYVESFETEALEGELLAKVKKNQDRDRKRAMTTQNDLWVDRSMNQMWCW